MRMRFIPAILLLTVLCTYSARAADVYRVTDEVRRANPPRFGLNFTLPPFYAWTAQNENSWNSLYSMEPIIFRWTFQATGGDEQTIINEQGAFKGLDPELHRHAKSSGAGYWKVFGDEFWLGAQVDIYRAVDGELRHIRRDRVKSFQSPSREEAKEHPDKAFPERIILEGTGEPIQRGDVYDVWMTRGQVPLALPAGLQTRGRNAYFRPMKNSGVEWEIDSSTFCPEDGSTASMKVSLPGDEDQPVGMEEQWLRWKGREMNWSLDRDYRLDVWMKSDLEEPVIVEMGDRGTRTVEVPGEWTKYSFKLENSEPITEDISYLRIKSEGAGTLWIDNLVVARTDVEPFAILPEWMEAIRDYEPGIIRDQGGRTLKTVDNFLVKNQFQRKMFWRESGPALSNHQGAIPLPLLLELCEETGANPYIMTYILWTDEEIEKFVEYLAGPVTTPGGALRASHGHPQPWTEAFDKIYIECANEMWNRNFIPQAFPNQPELCGMVADRLFREIEESPYAADNFEYVASAFVYSIYRDTDKYEHSGWTYRNLVPCEYATVVATGPSGYIGGWDGATPVGQNDEELFQSNLLYPARIFEPKQDKIEKLQAVMTEEHGRGTYEFIKYEAGPGYALPTPTHPYREETERIGKSLALGTATLDNFMFVIAHNGNMNYYKAEAGNNWASHNKHMLPHNTTLALSLRNVCEGDLLEVEAVDLDTIDLPRMQTVGLDNKGNRRKQMLSAVDDVPMTRVYAFRDGGRYSYVALNRSAEETRAITLELPYEPASEYTAYAYTGPSIRATNRGAETPDEMEIRVVKDRRNGFKKTFTFEIPPGQAVALVNRAR